LLLKSILINFILGVIFLNGVYVEAIMENGKKGIIIFHECDYFKEQLLFHKDGLEADKWVKAISEEA
jgi:hypothetical protein